MDRMEFTQAMVLISVLKTKLLTRADIDRMVEAKDVEQALRILSDTEYDSTLVEGIDRVEEYEEILSSEIENLYKTMYKIRFANVATDLLALKYDYHNLKVLVKEKSLGKDLSNLYIRVGTTNFQKTKDSYIHGDLSRLDPRFRKALNKVTMDFETNKDPQRIDLILDRFYFEHLHGLAQETDVKLFKNYVQDSIDFINMRTLLRLKKQNQDIRFLEEVLIPNGSVSRDKIVISLNDPIDAIISKFRCYDIRFNLEKGLLEYQKTGKLSEFEKQMDNHLIGLCQDSRYITFGPETIFSYIVAKEMEIKTLRIIMVSKLNQIAPDSIKKRLRDLYV